jgi:hypothetical protein
MKWTGDDMKPNDEMLPPALKRFYERLESGEFNRKPVVAVVTVPVSNKVAQVVKASCA